MTRKLIKRVLVRVPKEFLEEFDREINGFYASRNEAIRAGMSMVIEDRDKERKSSKTKIKRS